MLNHSDSLECYVSALRPVRCTMATIWRSICQSGSFFLAQELTPSAGVRGLSRLYSLLLTQSCQVPLQTTGIICKHSGISTCSLSRQDCYRQKTSTRASTSTWKSVCRCEKRTQAKSRLSSSRHPTLSTAKSSRSKFGTTQSTTTFVNKLVVTRTKTRKWILIAGTPTRNPM